MYELQVFLSLSRTVSAWRLRREPISSRVPPVAPALAEVETAPVDTMLVAVKIAARRLMRSDCSFD